MVDGVYDKDPHKYEDAVRYSRLTFSDVLGSALQVMDSTAASMCRDNKMPMLVFDLSRPETSTMQSWVKMWVQLYLRSTPLQQRHKPSYCSVH